METVKHTIWWIHDDVVRTLITRKEAVEPGWRNKFNKIRRMKMIIYYDFAKSLNNEAS
jgi:hypothetical protein